MCGYVAENRGTGYRAIVRELTRADMPAPKPEDLVSYFRLTFFAGDEGHVRRLGTRATPATTAVAQGAGPSDLNVEQGRIVEAVRELESASITELSQRLAVPRSTLSKRVAKLVEWGILKPTQPGSSPRQRYRLAG